MMNKELFREEIINFNNFKNEQCLELNFTPEELYHRTNLIKNLIHNFRGIITSNGLFSTNCLVLGKGGLGKTVSIKFFISNLKDYALERDIEIIDIYLNCTLFPSKSKVIREIYKRIFNNKFAQDRGYSDHELIKSLLTSLKKTNRYAFIILDEAHILKNDLIPILNIPESFGHHNARISFLLSCREHDWDTIKKEKIYSRIAHKIRIKPYTLEECFDIIEQRYYMAFKDGLISEANLRLISQSCFDKKNIRHGILILKNCGDYANKNQIRKIKSERIKEISHGILYSEFQDSIIDALHAHELLSLYVLCKILSKEKNTTIVESYNEYCKLCKIIKIKAHVQMSLRKYVRKLKELSLIKYNSIRTKSNRGRYNQIIMDNKLAMKLYRDLNKLIENKYKTKIKV